MKVKCYILNGKGKFSVTERIKQIYWLDETCKENISEINFRRTYISILSIPDKLILVNIEKKVLEVLYSVFQLYSKISLSKNIFLFVRVRLWEM